MVIWATPSFVHVVCTRPKPPLPAMSTWFMNEEWPLWWNLVTLHIYCMNFANFYFPKNFPFSNNSHIFTGRWNWNKWKHKHKKIGRAYIYSKRQIFIYRGEFFWKWPFFNCLTSQKKKWLAIYNPKIVLVKNERKCFAIEWMRTITKMKCDICIRIVY